MTDTNVITLPVRGNKQQLICRAHELLAEAEQIDPQLAIDAMRKAVLAKRNLSFTRTGNHVAFHRLGGAA